MGLTQITPPTVEPVTLADQKAFLRVSINDDDTLISAFITSARMYVEHYLGRQLVQATYQLTMDIFPLYTGLNSWPFLQQVPVPGAYQLGTYWLNVPNLGVLSPPDYTKTTLPGIANVVLAKPPLMAVNSVQYLDANGVLQTWANTNYQVITYNTPGYIRATSAFPAIQPWTSEAVKISYNAGYGVDGTTVPMPINTAIKLLVGGWYETRQPSEVQKGIEQAVHSLLTPYVFEGYY